MSLITDALKKAQKQRTGEAPPLASMPAIGGESAMRIAHRRRPDGLNTLLLRLGIGGGLLAIVIIGGSVLMRTKSTSGQSAPIPEAAPTKASEPEPRAAATTASANSFVVPIVAPSLPVATPPPAGQKTAPAPVIPSAAPAPAAALSTASVSAPVPPKLDPPKPEPANPAAPPAKLEPRAINYIESLRVVGIRASATDSKVLMNDRVYRIGSIIEHEMGIKLSGITSSSLTFEDERGGTYTRTF